MTTGIPFDDFRALAAGVQGQEEKAREAAQARLSRVDPDRRLGTLGNAAVWLAAWSGRMPPAVNRPQLAVFAGNHGVAAAQASKALPLRPRPPSSSTARPAARP